MTIVERMLVPRVLEQPRVGHLVRGWRRHIQRWLRGRRRCGWSVRVGSIQISQHRVEGRRFGAVRGDFADVDRLVTVRRYRDSFVGCRQHHAWWLYGTDCPSPNVQAARPVDVHHVDIVHAGAGNVEERHLRLIGGQWRRPIRGRHRQTAALHSRLGMQASCERRTARFATIRIAAVAATAYIG
jgi:hypothetical protein